MSSTAALPSVAIATVNHDTRPLLELLVRSVERYTPEPHRIYVFDNASTDGSRAYLAGLDGVVTVLSKENVGHVGGLNALVRVMTEDVLVCLDTDAHVYREGWLSALLGELDDNVKAVGFQSGFGGDPGKVAKSLHAFCLLVDLRPFREAGKLPDFSPVVEAGRQVIDVAGRISFDLDELGFDVKILMTDEESKEVPAAARRYPVCRVASTTMAPGATSSTTSSTAASLTLVAAASRCCAGCCTRRTLTCSRAAMPGRS